MVNPINPVLTLHLNNKREMFLYLRVEAGFRMVIMGFIDGVKCSVKPWYEGAFTSGRWPLVGPNLLLFRKCPLYIIYRDVYIRSLNEALLTLSPSL